MTSSEFKAARLALGLTQVELARALGYADRSRVSEIERGKEEPRAGVALLMDAYLAGYRPAIWPPVGRTPSPRRKPLTGRPLRELWTPAPRNR